MQRERISVFLNKNVKLSGINNTFLKHGKITRLLQIRKLKTKPMKKVLKTKYFLQHHLPTRY